MGDVRNDFMDRSWGFSNMADHDGDGSFTHKRLFPGEEEVPGNPQAVDIGSVIYHYTFTLLWTHEMWCTQDLAGPGEIAHFIENAGQAKVGQFHMPLLGDHDVGRF